MIEKQQSIAPMPSGYRGDWLSRKNCGPMIFPTAT